MNTNKIWLSFLTVLICASPLVAVEQDAKVDKLEALIRKQSEQIEKLAAEVEALKGKKSVAYSRSESGKIVTGEHVAAKEVPQKFQSSYPIKFYGYIKADLAYDSQRTTGNVGHYAYPGYDRYDDELNITANQSRFGFNIGGDPDSEYSPAGKIEVDFYGSNSPQNKAKVRMRKAYLTWKSGDWSFLAGQNTDVVTQVIPTCVDFNYYHLRGKLGYRNPQFKVVRNVAFDGGTFSPTVAISRTHGQDIDGDGQDDGADAVMPTVQFALPISGDFFGTGKSLLSIAGHYGREDVEFAQFSEGSIDSWSLGASWSIPLSDTLSVKGTVWTGANLDHLLAGIGQGTNPVTGKSIDSQGGWVQMGVKLSPKVMWSFGAGYDDPDDDDLLSGMRAQNMQYGTNVYIDVTTGLQFAMEYERIVTEYIDLPDGKNHRVQGSVIYKF